MKNPKFWWSLIIFLVVWSLFEIYPPSSRNLIQEFKDQADPSTIDTNFNAIVARAEAMEKTNSDPTVQFSELEAAIGTNDVLKYFTDFNVRGQENPTYALLNVLQRRAAGKIRLGIDLQGGTQFEVSLDTNRVVTGNTNLNALNAAENKERLVSQAADVLRRRVDVLGVTEPIITPSGDNHIIIQLPGLSQAAQDEARKNIEKPAFLEFRMVNPDSMKDLADGMIPPGYEILKMRQKQLDGSITNIPLLVQKKAAYGLTGKNVVGAQPSRGPDGGPEVELEFDADGATKFGKLTTENVGQEMAIVLDGEIYTAPRINSAITGGRCSISGGSMDITEATTIANILENPLETPVRIDAVSQVSPTLGEDSIKSGVASALYGTLAVVIFMAIYYHRCGLIADIAMLLNLVISLGIMCSIGTTLSLPGIAGVVLTVGMAVDANVLIYERLREEMALGKSMRGAISAAYARAFRTIFDSHSTTLISAIILIWKGTGPVKGFGVTLTIGVALSLFTALVVTRLIFDFLLNRGMLNKIGMMHIIKNPNWDFIKWTKLTAVLSTLLIIGGMGYGIFVRGAKVMGPQFAGGDSVTFSYNQRVDLEKIRADLRPKVGEVEIQYLNGSSGNNLEIVSDIGKGTNVAAIVPAAFPEAGFKALSVDMIGASVGLDIQKSAIIASFMSLIGILFYVAVRYEFSYAVGAVVAVVHDVLLTLGVFFLAQKQLSAPMVAAVLTIIGFSLNDKVVIFDRIREDLKLGARGTFREVINKAINQTLSRTIITSGTVFLATLSLYLFGGGVIHDFAFTFLVGIITGTYSSIYIACALVLWWHKGERPKTASQVTMETAAARGTARA